MCSKCKDRKSSKCFSKNVNTKDGLLFWCKKCNREYYLGNRDRMLEYGGSIKIIGVKDWNTKNNMTLRVKKK